MSKHRISFEQIKDIDGTILWHYGICACGWESGCFASKTKVDSAVIDHRKLSGPHDMRTIELLGDEESQRITLAEREDGAVITVGVMDYNATTIGLSAEKLWKLATDIVDWFDGRVLHFSELTHEEQRRKIK